MVEIRSDKPNLIFYCDEFGVAKYAFKTSDYNSNNEINIELKNVTIRRLNKNRIKKFGKILE